MPGLPRIPDGSSIVAVAFDGPGSAEAAVQAHGVTPAQVERAAELLAAFAAELRAGRIVVGGLGAARTPAILVPGRRLVV